MACFIKSRILYTIFLASLLLGLSFSVFANNSANAALTKEELQKVNKRIIGVQKKLLQDKNYLKDEQESLYSIELSLSKLNKKITELQYEKDRAHKNTLQLKGDKNKLLQAKQQQQETLKKDLRVIYQLGNQEKIKLLLNQENPDNLSRTLKYYDYYSEARVKRILDFQKNIAQVEEKEKAIDKETEHLNRTQLALNKKNQELKTKQKERQGILKDIKRSISNSDQELTVLKSDRAQLSQLLQSLKDIWADIPKKLGEDSFRALKGKFKKPVSGSVKHSFGSKRVEGRLKWHGWLISSPMNTSVNAIHTGRVVFSDWIRSYGLLIIVDHGDNYLSLYGHNASLLKETGDWVSSGEAIARVGNSGGQYRSGLYFEIRHQGKPLDPTLWIQ